MILIKASINEIDCLTCEQIVRQVQKTCPEQSVLFVPDNIYIKEHCSMDDLLEIEKFVNEAKIRLIEEEDKGGFH